MPDGAGGSLAAGTPTNGRAQGDGVRRPEGRAATPSGAGGAAPPRLSVVVPTHRTRELTLRCLQSIATAAPADTQVVVVDDASADGTAAAIADRYPAVAVLVNERRAGFSRTANRGLAAAAGDILLLLNSDTEVPDGSLGTLLDAFAADPELGIAGAELRFPDGLPQWSAGRRPSTAWLLGQASGVPALVGRFPGYRRLRPPGKGPGAVDWVSGAAMAMRRGAWESAGPLDEGYRFYCQDLDLCLTAGDRGWKVAVVPGFVVIHHHGSTIAASSGAASPFHPELMWTDLVRFAHRHGGPRAARRAAAALRAGARLRLAGRAIAAPLLARSDRERWRRESEAFRKGLRALTET